MKKDKNIKQNCDCENQKPCTCGDECDCKTERVFDTENDLNIAIIKNGKDLLLNEDCCTCVNIMLNNDGRILTSFLGCHNPYIVEQLEKAQKMYFKGLKKALKQHYFCTDENCACGCGDDQCACGDDCDCNNSKCNCSPDCTCGCQDGQECTCGGECTCGDDCTCEKGTSHDCGCGGKNNKNKKKK